MVKSLLLTAIFVIALVATANAVPVIYNGSFEIPDVADGQTMQPADGSFGWWGTWPGGASLHNAGRICDPDWTGFCGTRNVGDVPDGEQVLRMRGNLVWQTNDHAFTLTPGETITWAVEAKADLDTTEPLVGKFYFLNVTDDVYLDYMDSVSEGYTGGALTTWCTYESSFVVPASAAGDQCVLGYWLLNLAGQGSNHGMYIDNYRIVPEPATLILLGLGGIAALRRKHA